jgi:hypothetical protein
LALSPELKSSITALNQIVVESGFCEISFNGGSPHIPHVTLIMGEVGDEADFASLVTVCEAFTSHMKQFSYKTSAPYLKRPSQHFIFTDTLPQEHFRSLRRSLYEEAGQFIECDHHGGPDNPSHITIGYAKPIYPFLSKLVSVYKRPSGCAEMLQICAAGSRGTCVEILHQILIGD